MPCERCGSLSSLELHHIRPMAFGGNDESNAAKVYLCRRCHHHVHSKRNTEWEHLAWSVERTDNFNHGVVHNQRGNVANLYGCCPACGCSIDGEAYERVLDGEESAYPHCNCGSHGYADPRGVEIVHVDIEIVRDGVDVNALRERILEAVGNAGLVRFCQMTR